MFVDAHLWPAVAGFEVRAEHTLPVRIPVQALLELNSENMQVYAVDAPPDPLAHDGRGAHEELRRRAEPHVQRAFDGRRGILQAAMEKGGHASPLGRVVKCYGDGAL